MNLKKHQGEPNMDTSDSEIENQNIECTHINKSVDLQKVKKTLTRIGFLKDCEGCKNLPADGEADIEYDMSLWLCLKCGNQACGRDRNCHALKHYNIAHSDCHAICVNTIIWSVWCYLCNEEVKISFKKKLQEAVDYLKKQSESANINEYNMPPKDRVFEGIPISNSTGTTPKVFHSDSFNFPRARGLANLGNTCFFNSVMQCLAQTPYLLRLLEETSQEGQHCKLPGGEIKNNNGEIITLQPLEGVLEKWKSLPETLAHTLKELQSGRSEVLNPRMLFSRLTAKMPQFGGGDQHDSHELLRHLLEAVREEDLKRYKTVILQKLGYNNKTNPSTVEGEQKKIIKFYGQQASEMQSPTEQVFRGVLVSTLQCQVCDHTSHRDEFFLDLSLPISEKQLPPVLRRKADEIEDNKPSKHQIKKDKRSERQKKRQKNRNSSNYVFSNPVETSADVSLEAKSDSESDADIEDNIDDSSNNIQEVEFPKGTESGYNSDKVDNSSPDLNNRIESPTMRVDDSGVPSPVIGILNSPVSLENSSGSSETNIDMGSPSMVCGNNSPSEDMGDFERPQSRLAFVSSKNTDLKVDLEKLSLLNDGDSNKIHSLLLHNDNNNMDGACGPVEPLDEKMEEGDYEETDVSLWSETIAPRYQCEEGECSIQSCLNQFTECELMAGNNKVACELCTKRHGGPDKKTIYTDASKQLLIYNPPAVLILHLKRFQVLRFRSTKVSKFVKFSTLLDLAPFCSKRSLNLPSIEVGQTKVLYSLYGIVEHSGSIHGGHYVAYVKVRPPLEENSYKWQFIPKNQTEKVENTPNGALGDPVVPKEKWYYISDSYVSEVPESKVLSAQAYLLFYERII